MQRTVQHLYCTQRILRYVNDTKDRGPLYQTGIADQLVGYMDVNWAGNVGDRISTSRFTFSLGSIAISCSSKKQSTIALSSMEAEY